jgi:hypothetical protein
MKVLFLSLFLFLTTIASHAQSTDFPEADVDQLMDDWFTFQVEDANFEEAYENLTQLIAHPLDINKASAEDLRFLNLLSVQQIQSILSYRGENGPFVSVYELQSVEGLDLSTIRKIIPFLRVTVASNTPSLRQLLHESDQYLMVGHEQLLQKKKGFTDQAEEHQRFLGSPGRLYTRFRKSKAGSYSIGFTTEKDEGEMFAWNPAKNRYGFDYVSAHAQVQNKGRLKNMVLGDYQVQFGQGLMFGGFFGIGKGGETVTASRKSNVGLMPYTSVYEAGYLRGVGLTTKLTSCLYVTGFYSHTKRDATVGTQDDQNFISAFQQTGLHRTASELSRRKAIREQNAGLILQYTQSRVDAGIMFSHIDFNIPVQKIARPYNQFSFSGRQNQNTGLFFNYTIHNISFFSEFSKTQYGGLAYLLGSLWSLTSKMDFAFMHRHYEADYQAFYSNAFGESSTTQNESGVYWGWRYRFNRKWVASGYTDLFRFPWLQYRVYAPATGHEWLVRVHYQPYKTTALFAQVREESKPRNYSASNTTVHQVTDSRKRNYWLNADYGLPLRLKFRTRLQISTFELGNALTTGSTLVQDIRYDLGKLKITGRYAVFDTDDFDNRQYVFENDVWLSTALSAYYGTGIRRYALIQYDLNRHITCWIKYGNTRYSSSTKTGTGADVVEGPVREEVKVQLRFRW